MHTHNLAPASHASCKQLPPKLNPPRFRVHGSGSDEIIDSEFDSLFRGDTLYRQMLMQGEDEQRVHLQ